MFKEMAKPAPIIKYFTKKAMQIVVDRSQWFARGDLCLCTTVKERAPIRS